MRAYDFIREDDETGDIHSNIVTVLSLIKTKIDQGELQAKLPASMVVRMVQNTGVINFSVEDLKAANDEIPAMKNIIKQIAGDEVLFKTDSYSTVSNADDDFGSVDNPQQTVSNMAKAALKRRQD
jgi:hypothetical protein